MTAGIEYLLSNQEARISFLVLLIILFLPTQLGLHFWPEFSIVNGLRVDYLSPTLYFSDVLIILLISLSFSEKLIGSLFQYLRKPPLLLFLCILILGVFLSKNIPAGIYGIIKIIEFLFLTLAIAKNIQKFRLRIILPATICGILFESILAIIQFQKGGSLGGLFYFLGERFYNGATPNIANASLGGELVLRPYATFSHPNVLAGYLVISMLILALAMSSKYKENSLYYLAIFFGTVGLMLTLSRTAIIIWALVLLTLLFKKINRIALFIPLVLGGAILFPQIMQRFGSISLVDSSFADRINLAKASVQMIIHNPILGVGINNFLNNVSYYNFSASPVFMVQPVHNIILLTISQTGIICGAVIFYYAAKLFLYTSSYAKILLLAFLGLGMFDHYFLTLQQGQILLCLILAVAIADLKKKQKSAKI